MPKILYYQAPLLPAHFDLQDSENTLAGCNPFTSDSYTHKNFIDNFANMSEASRLKSTLFVGGLDNIVNQSTLHTAFIPFGDIVDISIPKPDLPSSTDPHRGFAYVEFESAEDAREAIDNMDQSELYGKILKVAPAKPQREQNEGLGSKAPIWEQVCARTIPGVVKGW